MTTTAKIADGGTAAIPSSFLAELRSRGGKGAFVIEIAGDALTLNEIDPDQAWFWTREWQAGEAEADRDLAGGRFKRFLSDEEFLSSF